MFIHTNTVTTLSLVFGDVTSLGIVASVERSVENLGAALIRFTDGTWFHAGTHDAWPIHRA